MPSCSWSRRSCCSRRCFVIATAALQNDMQAVLRSEAIQLADIRNRYGLLALAEQVTRAHELPHPRADLLSRAGRRPSRVVVGNLPGMPPVEGRRRLRGATPTSKSMPAPSSPASASPCPTARSSWWRRDASRLIDMQHAIVRGPSSGPAASPCCWRSPRGVLVGGPLRAPHRHDRPHQPRHHGG